jgi:hypothetical protein
MVMGRKEKEEKLKSNKEGKRETVEGIKILRAKGKNKGSQTEKKKTN